MKKDVRKKILKKIIKGLLVINLGLGLASYSLNKPSLAKDEIVEKTDKEKVTNLLHTIFVLRFHKYDYTEESFNKFEEVIKTLDLRLARDYLDLKDKEGKEFPEYYKKLSEYIKEYQTKLEEAIKQLKTTPNYAFTKAREKIDEAANILTNHYSKYDEDSLKHLTDIYNEVEPKINSLKDKLPKDKTEQDRTNLDEYTKKLDDAIKALKLQQPEKIKDIVRADYTNLNKVILQAKEKLSKENNYQEGIHQLKESLSDIYEDLPKELQPIVDYYEKTIKDSLDKLVLKEADYKLVEQAISKIPSDLSVFTLESLNKLEVVKKAVQRGLKIDQQDKVNEFARNIENAITALTIRNYKYKMLTSSQKITLDDIATFVSEAPYGKYKHVEIENEIISTGIKVSQGSTKVVIENELIRKLGVGKHHIRIVSIDGYSETDFEIITSDIKEPENKLALKPKKLNKKIDQQIEPDNKDLKDKINEQLEIKQNNKEINVKEIKDIQLFESNNKLETKQAYKPNNKPKTSDETKVYGLMGNGILALVVAIILFIRKRIID